MKARQLIKEIEQLLKEIGEMDADILIYSEGFSLNQQVSKTKLEQSDYEEVIFINW